MLTRSRGDFEEILAGSDLVVELMGGLDPARDYVLRAMAAGKHVVTANKQLLSQHGEELWAAAREHGVQLRFEAAVAGVVPVIRVLQESLAGAHVDRLHGIVNGTTNFILTRDGRDRRLLRRRAGRGPGSWATPRPTRPRTSTARTRRPRWRSSRGWPSTRRCTSTRCPTRASSTSPPTTWSTPRDLGLGLKLIGTAERVDGGLSVRVHPAFLYGGHPLASVNGPFNAVTIESQAITEITLSGPGAGGPQTASAVLGDVISAMIPPASTPETTDALAIVSDVESAFYLHLEVADRPGVLAQVAQLLGLQGASIRSVVQKGLGENARLVMVTHPLLESQFFARARADRRPGLHARPAARDPGHRRGVPVGR